MDYLINQITTIEDCDVLLDKAARKREALDHKKYMETRTYNIVSSGAAGVDAEIAVLQTQITTLENLIPGMPDEAKKKYQEELYDLNHSKHELEKHRDKYGTLALLQKQYAMASIDKEIEENDAFVQAVTERRGKI